MFKISIWISWRIWWYSISMKQFIHYLLDFTRKTSPTIMEKHIQYDIWNGSKDASIETSLRRGHINVSSFIKSLQRDPPTKIGNRNTFFTKGMVFFSFLSWSNSRNGWSMAIDLVNPMLPTSINLHSGKLQKPSSTDGENLDGIWWVSLGTADYMLTCWHVEFNLRVPQTRVQDPSFCL